MRQKQPKRRNIHRRNPKLEILLKQLNDLLAISEEQEISQFISPQYPVLLIVGCPRSGSTLIHQWLANSDLFAYPTNLLSRFYKAPYIGALIQIMITDPEYAFNEELFEFQTPLNDYCSTLGKTKGVLSPHNFLYFWRRFFNFDEIQYLDKSRCLQVDTKAFLSELAAIESVFNQPLALKAMIINWNINFLHKFFNRFLFIHIKRDPLQNAQSLLAARQDFYGSIDPWYSYKPPEYTVLKGMSPYEQVAGQVYFTNKAISDQLTNIPSQQWLQIDYSSFCANPERYYEQLVSKLSDLNYQINTPYKGPESFIESSAITLKPDKVRLIMKSFDKFENLQ